MARDGTDITIITYGRQVWTALEAATTLSEDGIEAEVVDLQTLVPLDERTVIESAVKTTRVLIVHEAVRRGGFGAEVAALIHEHAFGELSGPVRRIAGADSPVPYSKPLEDAFVPSAQAIVDAARSAVR
jgi:pyruvate dehydrogenase E1 component beta subunit